MACFSLLDKIFSVPNWHWSRWGCSENSLNTKQSQNAPNQCIKRKVSPDLPSSTHSPWTPPQEVGEILVYQAELICRNKHKIPMRSSANKKRMVSHNPPTCRAFPNQERKALCIHKNSCVRRDIWRLFDTKSSVSSVVYQFDTDFRISSVNLAGALPQQRSQCPYFS